MVMFDLAWMMSKDLSDMLWCVRPSYEQLHPHSQGGSPLPGECRVRPLSAHVQALVIFLTGAPEIGRAHV